MFRVLEERWGSLYGGDPASVRPYYYKGARRLRDAATRDAVQARPGAGKTTTVKGSLPY